MPNAPYQPPNAYTEVIELDILSSEVERIRSWMSATCQQHGTNYGLVLGKDPIGFVVEKVFRIQNWKLWKYYCEAKRDFKDQNPRLRESESGMYLSISPMIMECIDNSVSEYRLFHGTDFNVIDIIKHYGFDERYSSVNGMFGAGIYFAENSSKSNQYVPCPHCGKGSIFKDKDCQCSLDKKKGPDIVYGMVIARVMMGDVHICKQYKEEIYKGTPKNPVRLAPTNPVTKRPHDAVLGEATKYGGNSLKFREIIIYDRKQAYPEYIVHYKRRPPA